MFGGRMGGSVLPSPSSLVCIEQQQPRPTRKRTGDQTSKYGALDKVFLTLLYEFGPFKVDVAQA